MAANKYNFHFLVLVCSPSFKIPTFLYVEKAPLRSIKIQQKHERIPIIYLDVLAQSLLLGDQRPHFLGGRTCSFSHNY